MMRRAERTHFNTEYMPELYEDVIESNDPLAVERKAHGHIGNVLYDDRHRFYKLCKQHGYDCKAIKNESRRKHPDF